MDHIMLLEGPLEQEPVRINIAEILSSLNEVYHNENTSLSAMLEDGTYTASTLRDHVAQLYDIIEELRIIYDLDAETTLELETLADDILLAWTKYDEQIIELDDAATRISGYYDELNTTYTALTDTTSTTFEPNAMNFVHYLKYMGQGMLIIMLVMAILIAGTMLLNKVTGKIAAAREARLNEDEQNKN